MKRLLALIALLLAFVCPALAQDYPDGIYRGFYYDGGIEQIAIQFELKDVFSRHSSIAASNTKTAIT